MLKRLERYIEICGFLLIPLAVFAAVWLHYLAYCPLGYERALVYHIALWGGNFALLLVLLYFNQGRLLFFAAVSTLAYLSLNLLKQRLGADFSNSLYYHNILVLLPYNLWCFYLFFPRRFISGGSLLSLLLILSEYILLDILVAENINLNYVLYGLNIPVIGGFALFLLWAFINMIRRGNLYDGTVLFAGLSVAAGVFFATEVSGLVIFFCLESYIILAFVIWRIFYNKFFDETTSIYNRYSYLKRSRGFPPKYSLGIISIDGYDGLSRGLTHRQNCELVNLLLEIIKENIDEFSTIYRYAENSFIIVCEKINQKEIYEVFETIRRAVAGSEFALSGHPQPIKITISGGVAEKRRTDANADAVLTRADSDMQKTLKFTGNVISPQPRVTKR